ncbi:transcription elongation factor GreA [Dehalogenimonas formicexedens]|uniref:Transcription elongation factor GreA n=1 Tax=Dehalogenimonas formicexedens TaxID=1839801 RepID=A0A1P8F789_9CHLR|nr:GreA/GreB family elongation factor [Dehalogenimonas formicexedens]APV44320.1 transcription elongation factor GreA [Dehalogenimonas formicexedens]
MTPNEIQLPSNLADAAVAYLGTLSPAKRDAVTPAIMNFVRWYGGGNQIENLSPPKLGEYADGQPSGADGGERMKALREFLGFAAKKGWTETNYGIHLKAKKSPSRLKAAAAVRLPEVERLVLTPEKQTAMQQELSGLKERRFHVIEDIKRAAADKDLKENAPYHAAREEKAKIDGKIKELETLLKHAVISEQKECLAGATAELGHKVTLRDQKTGVVTVYTLVTTREVNPKTGRISPASPIGKAIIGHSAGEIIEVVAPAFVHRFTIECIE